MITKPGLVNLDIQGSGKVTWHKEVEVEAEDGSMAEGFRIGKAYPNPFNFSCTVPFILNKSLTVSIKLYNLTGQQVMDILNQELPRRGIQLFDQRQSAEQRDLYIGFKERNAAGCIKNYFSPINS